MSTSSPELALIICAYNPRAAVFLRVLEALNRQSLAPSRREVLVVDNRSDPPIAERVELQPLLSKLGARIVIESRPGLTPARLRGFAETTAPVLVLCDDDTLLAHDYLQQVLDICAREPALGAFGGVIAGEFVQAPADWQQGFLNFLAIRDHGPLPMRALAPGVDGPWDPVGAGMALRREVAERYALLAADPRRAGLDRVGSSLSSCGDSDLARTATDLGLYLGYEPALRLTHVIPPERLTLRYMRALAYSIARDGMLLRRLRGQAPQVAATFSLKRLLRGLLLALAIDPRILLVRLAQLRGREHGMRLELNP